MKRIEKREHLIDVATELFNRYGYHAVGIDQIIAEAGVAKTTLYRHFKSKEELIVVVLRRLDEQSREDMRNQVDRMAKDPKKKLLATFDFFEDWFKDKSFYGCPYVSAAGEYCDHSNPVFQEAVLHKRLVVAYLEELARAANLNNPKRVAEEIALLQEGATAVAHITADISAARKAKALAARIIEDALD